MPLYNLSIFLLNVIFNVVSPFNPKAKKWLEGRKGLLTSLKHDFKSLPNNCIWFHCASLGEFEQGRPLIESLEAQGHKIILSFYSPSGYEIRKNYDKVEKVFYLPLDTKKNAKKLLDIIQPKALFVVKNDLWYQILKETHSRSIPMFLVSATFKKRTSFSKLYEGLQSKMLHFFKHIFVQDQSSQDLLKQMDIDAQIAGDTRVDRVLEIKNHVTDIKGITKFVDEKKCFLAGSTWATDEALLFKLINTKHFDGWKLIIAPHDISENHLDGIARKFQNKIIKYSSIERSHNKFNVLVIDNIGMLSSLYKYADLAYIGGGFGAGIHNTLEPAAFGVPMFFGPKYKKFIEAVKLVERKGAYAIKDYQSLESAFLEMKDQETYSKAHKEIVNYLDQNKGATDFILNEIRSYL